MQIALIADIHGNYPALEAVLADAGAHGADMYIFAGDLIFDLPYANEVTERIRGLTHAVVIRGNKERWLEQLIHEDASGWQAEQFGAAYQTVEELTPSNRDWLITQPDEARITLPGCPAGLYSTHFIEGFSSGHRSMMMSSSRFREEMERNPFTHADYLERIRLFWDTDERRIALLKNGAEMTVIGHSHIQWHTCVGDMRIINPGSCGLPLDYDSRAAYTLLRVDADGIAILERRVPYDVAAVIHYTRSTRQYRRGEVWSELVFKALRESRDVFRPFFDTAEAVRAETGESGYPFSNAVWREAAARYFTSQ